MCRTHLCKVPQLQGPHRSLLCRRLFTWHRRISLVRLNQFMGSQREWKQNTGFRALSAGVCGVQDVPACQFRSPFAMNPCAGARNKPGHGYAYGAGVRVDTPVGPLRLEYAWNKSRKGRFHVGVGYD